MMPLKAGIIGLGVGEQHARAVAALSTCQVAWLCDLDDEKLDRLRPEFSGARVTRDADEVLTDPTVDFVVIASYDDRHADQMITALEHGKHVFVEKPICQSADELERICAALDRHPGLVLGSNLILRRSPRLQALKRSIAAGEFGELFYVEADYAYGRVHKITEGWRGQLPCYSVMAGGGIHMIDMILWLTGGSVLEVQGFGNQIATRNTAFRFNDFQVALLRLQNDAIAKVSANFACVHPHHHLFAIYGTKRTFVQNVLGAAYIETRDPAVAPAPDPTTAFVAKGAFIPNFVDAILGRAPPEIARHEILDTMRVCAAIDRAIEERRTVRLQATGNPE
jgi:predicted dehydrogenase